MTFREISGKGGQVFEGTVKIRYRHPGVSATFQLVNDGESPPAFRVLFRTPQKAVAPGQAAVFYDGNRVVGGGWIEEGFGES